VDAKHLRVGGGVKEWQQRHTSVLEYGVCSGNTAIYWDDPKVSSSPQNAPAADNSLTDSRHQPCRLPP
jgi:hypothetical protein